MSKITDNLKTCKDCNSSTEYLLKPMLIEGGLLRLLRCDEPTSDHYCHFLNLDHPACIEIEESYPEGGK